MHPHHSGLSGHHNTLLVLLINLVPARGFEPLTYRMKRRAPDESVESFRYRYHADEARPLREGGPGRMVRGARGEPNGCRAEAAAGHRDRDGDCWEPLLAIADIAGDDWPKRARDAAVALNSRVADETLTTGVELLRPHSGSLRRRSQACDGRPA
jgi:hypothetical protein